MKFKFNQCMNRNFGVRLKTQLFIAFVTVLTLLMMCVVVTTYQKTEKVIEDQTAELTQQYLEQSRYNMSTYAEKINKVLFSLSEINGIARYFKTGWENSTESILNTVDIFNSIRNIINQYEEIDSVFFYGNDGVVLGVSSTENLIYCSDSAKEVYYGSRIQRHIEETSWQPLWTGGYTSADFGLKVDASNKGIPYITVARSININTKPIGVVLINIRENEFYQDIWKSTKDAMGRGMVLDENGIVIADVSSEELGHIYEEEETLSAEGKDNFIVGDKQIHYLRIDSELGMNWTLVYEIPLSSLYKNIYSLRDVFILTAILALLVGSLVIIYLLYRISKPLDQLQIAMKKMQQYDIGIKLEKQSRTELGQLGVQFDEMSNSIERMIKQIQTMEKEKCYLEEKVLQSQINPHFLFNTLSNIKYMAMIIKSNTIADCITALGNILTPIYRSNQQEWTVEEELHYIENYVKIMNYRFGGKIHVEYQVSQENKEARILRFILQPLMENSIIHGFEQSGEEKKILVRIAESDGLWNVTVKDNGSGIEEEKLEQLRRNIYCPEEKEPGQKQKHIGLRNVYQRLQLFYGENYSLHIQSEKGVGTEITMTFPTGIKTSSEIVILKQK